MLKKCILEFIRIKTLKTNRIGTMGLVQAIIVIINHTINHNHTYTSLYGKIKINTVSFDFEGATSVSKCYFRSF